MRKINRWLFAAGCLIAASIQAQPLLPMPDSGSTTFGDWSFSWEIGNANDEGLVIRDVRWKGVKVLHKGSMPVIRVKYRGGASSIDSGCGPYRDRISSGNISRFSGQFTDVVARVFDSNVLELAVFSEIGGYDLYQAWYFHKSGRLEPMLYSSGWSCNDNGAENNHRHHPYWRLDFDVDGTPNRVTHAMTVNNSTTFASYNPESGFTVPGNASATVWTVTNSQSSKRVEVRSPSTEHADAAGSPWFGFSVRDVGVRRYHASEDEGWTFSTNSQLGYFTPPEITDGQDSVFWAIGHLTHTWSQADKNDPHWHSVGWVIDAKW
jgi:hypothetical protein